MPLRELLSLSSPRIISEFNDLLFSFSGIISYNFLTKTLNTSICIINLALLLRLYLSLLAFNANDRDFFSSIE